MRIIGHPSIRPETRSIEVAGWELAMPPPVSLDRIGIVYSDESTIGVVYGAPSLNPQHPTVPNGAMVLAIWTFPGTD